MKLKLIKNLKGALEWKYLHIKMCKKQSQKGAWKTTEDYDEARPLGPPEPNVQAGR